MDEIIQKVSRRLDLSEEDIYSLLSRLLINPNYEEDILELLGYDMMEEITYICQNKNFFVVDEEYKETKNYVEHILPMVQIIKPNESELRSVGDLRPFFGYKNFNLLQSKVFNDAFNSDGNLLISAPTGAGKTDVAFLTILRALEQEKKIVFIAPMKALATEITRNYQGKFSEYRKFGQETKDNTMSKQTLNKDIEQVESARCFHKDVKVIEYTGDTSTTTKEVKEANIIVCTPEKFDVATRKLHNVFQESIGLLVIDEIHLLQDDRGPVLEAIVSRIFRYVELTQHIIRIVGLSATLPNYKDIARFIKAMHIHNFDQRYRPVPLETSLIGVTQSAIKRNDNTNNTKGVEDQVLVERVDKVVSNKEQVLVFVHSRNQTVKTGQMLLDSLNRLPTVKMKRLPKDLQGQCLHLFNHRIGVHHAGLPRHLRLFMEECFRNKTLDILVCTSTLAWGVNLPANAVIIKGTTYYNPDKGQYADLSILDVLQIFGRAGRPQYSLAGNAVLITTAAKLPKYLHLIKNKKEIESRLLHHIADILNAEIYLGSVTDIASAMLWLRSTFMYVRLLRNPTLYGLSYSDLHYEEQALSEYVVLTIKMLEESKMITVAKYSLSDYNTWSFDSTVYGQVAAMYYVSYKTLRLWLNVDEQNTIGLGKDVSGSLNTKLENKMEHIRKGVINNFKGIVDGELHSKVDTKGKNSNRGSKPNEKNKYSGCNIDSDSTYILKDLLSAVEFNSIALREEEDHILHQVCEDLGLEFEPTLECKLHTLTQAYLRKYPIYKFSLACDTSFTIDNLQRLVMAMFEILLYQSEYTLAYSAFILSKHLERQKSYRWNDSTQHKRNELSLAHSEASLDIGYVGSKAKQHINPDPTVKLERIKSFIRLQIDTKLNSGSVVFVCTKSKVIYALPFLRFLDTFFECDQNVIKIKILTMKNWCEWSKELFCSVDTAIRGLYYNGIHSCERSWSLTEKKDDCLHFRIANYVCIKAFSEQNNQYLDKSCGCLDAPCINSNDNYKTKDEVVVKNLENKAILLTVHDYKNNERWGITKFDEVLNEAGDMFDIRVISPSLRCFRPFIHTKYNLDISFVPIYAFSYLEREKLIAMNLLKLLNSQMRCIIVTSSMDAMRKTYIEIETNLALRNISTEVSCGRGIKNFRGIYVTTFQEAHIIENDALVIFKGCRTSRWYYPIFEVLRISDHRRCLIYEDENYINYFKKAVLCNE